MPETIEYTQKYTNTEEPMNKRILALFTAALMILALALPAFAQDHRGAEPAAEPPYAEEAATVSS